LGPQYTIVTERTDKQTDRQRSDSTGRTFLQTVAQKLTLQSCHVPWSMVKVMVSDSVLFGGILGALTPKMESNINETPKRHIYAIYWFYWCLTYA